MLASSDKQTRLADCELCARAKWAEPKFVACFQFFLISKQFIGSVHLDQIYVKMDKLKVRLSQNEYMKSSIFQNTNRKIDDFINSFWLDLTFKETSFKKNFKKGSKK